jgi:tRNA-modifying protein YgfZ
MPRPPVSKPTLVESSPFPLPGCSALLLQGPDAPSVAQSQFANDVRALAPGDWQWNCWLNPKGRVIALFRLARLDDETLLALLPDFPAEALGQRLARYLFRSRLRLEAAELVALGCWDKADDAPERRQALGDLASGLHLRIDPGRRIELRPGSAADAGPEPQDWRLADIRAGIPRLAAEDVETYTAHMLGLEALPAVSLTKGCFPGHEILARSHYLGQVKRRLCRVRSDAPLPQRGEIVREGVSLGRLLCSAAAGEASEGLAVLALDAIPADGVMGLDPAWLHSS